MSRLKLSVTVLLTLALLVALALMPRAVAGITDLLADEKGGTASMQSVELAFPGDQTELPGYMMRKLALEQRMTSVPITAEQAAMTEDQVYAAAEAAMEIYVQAGLFEWFEVDFQSLQPYLGIDPNDKSNNTLFWGVDFTKQGDQYQDLFLHIDDETGKILYISYTTNAPDKFNYYYPENQHAMMESFVDAFFSPLNLADRSEYEGLLGESAVEQELTDDVTCILYTFHDAQYGMMHIEFYITPSGFHVYFPG